MSREPKCSCRLADAFNTSPWTSSFSVAHYNSIPLNTLLTKLVMVICRRVIEQGVLQQGVPIVSVAPCCAACTDQSIAGYLHTRHCRINGSIATCDCFNALQCTASDQLFSADQPAGQAGLCCSVLLFLMVCMCVRWQAPCTPVAGQTILQLIVCEFASATTNPFACFQSGLLNCPGVAGSYHVSSCCHPAAILGVRQPG